LNWQSRERQAERVKITDVRTVCTAPEGTRLVIVRVGTSEPGLYGLGCATFTQRPLGVVTAVEQYLKPFVTGRDADNIEDIWQAAQLSSYWRHGPVLNNALSGVDMALWDIKAKRAGMPLYQLFGGKCRRAADVYVHAHGSGSKQVAARAQSFIEQGFRHIRCQVAVPGRSTYGTGAALRPRLDGLETPGEWWGPRQYCRIVPRLFEELRSMLGEDVELLHDVHERVPPTVAPQLAKDLEFRLDGGVP
jgi:mannonate dehydratase